MLDIDLLVLGEVLEVIGEGREGSSVDVDLLVQLEHLQEFDRVEAEQLKLSGVDRHILEVTKLLSYRRFPDRHSCAPHVILKLKLLFLLILLLAVLFLEEDVLRVDLEGVLEYVENPIPGDE